MRLLKGDRKPAIAVCTPLAVLRTLMITVLAVEIEDNTIAV